jgi:hypothetical protein
MDAQSNKQGNRPASSSANKNIEDDVQSKRGGMIVDLAAGNAARNGELVPVRANSEELEEDSEDESEDSDDSTDSTESESLDDEDNADFNGQTHIPTGQSNQQKRNVDERDRSQDVGSMKEVFERPRKVTRYETADGTTVMRAGLKPEINRTQVQSSSLLNRLRTFMPEMAAANDQLAVEQQAGTISKRVMEVGDDENDGNYIEMVFVVIVGMIIMANGS